MAMENMLQGMHHDMLVHFSALSNRITQVGLREAPSLPSLVLPPRVIMFLITVEKKRKLGQFLFLSQRTLKLSSLALFSTA